ncbi:MAG: FtsW/RodA/SpoVE family cell cycle protein [Phycisphaerales bacterium]|nr:FtsW/RodA/SpoVE family cell cycle protein [Phycisphaerales bacterium]
MTAVSSRRLYEGARAVAQPRLLLLNPGWLAVLSSLGLAALGVYGIHITEGLTADAGGLSDFASKQLAYLAAGLVAATVATVWHFRWWCFYRWALAAATLAMLVFLLLPGVPESIVRPRNGARAWIDLGPINFQPGELAKFVFVLLAAGYLRFRENHRRLIGLIPPALIAFVPIGLIVVQPDLGMALLFLPTLVFMLIAAGARLSHLIATAAMGVAFAAAIVLISFAAAQNDQYPLLRKYQLARIQAVVDQIKGDTRHVQDRGFQGRQALTLVGAGGIVGQRESVSRAQLKFNELPERRNDMIFAVLANRFGFFGVAALLGLYLLWVAGAMLVSAASKDPFGRLVCVGFAAIIAVQMGINIGMTLGILPITGLTLPFVSYGGSSMIVGMLMTGLVLNIGLRRPDYLWRLSFEFDEPPED